MRRILVAMVVTGFWAGSAQAQTCTGTMNAAMHVGGDVAFSSSTRNFTGGATKDTGKFFVRGAGAVASVSGVGTGAGLLVAAGTEMEMNKGSRPLSVCPTVNLVKLWGISGASPMVLSFGATVGFEATTMNTTRVVPTFGLFFNRLSTHFGGTGTGGGGGSYGQNYGILQAGVGFILNEKMSIVPSIFVPFALAGGEVIFSVLFSWKLR